MEFAYYILKDGSTTPLCGFINLGDAQVFLNTQNANNCIIETAAELSAPTWIPWDGGTNIAAPPSQLVGLNVEVKLRAGQVYKDISGQFYWNHVNGGGDIMFYRLV
jgi:hypothetical protein